MKFGLKAKIKKAGAVLFVLYIVALIYFLFFAEQYGRADAAAHFYRYNLIPFREIKRFWIYRETVGIEAMLINIGGNVAGFIPFGLFLPLLSKNTRSFMFIMLSGLAVSLSVEIIQLVSRVGSFDVDDLILNTVGAIIGYVVFKVCKALYEALYAFVKGA